MVLIQNLKFQSNVKCWVKWKPWIIEGEVVFCHILPNYPSLPDLAPSRSNPDCSGHIWVTYWLPFLQHRPIVCVLKTVLSYMFTSLFLINYKTSHSYIPRSSCARNRVLRSTEVLIPQYASNLWGSREPWSPEANDFSYLQPQPLNPSIHLDTRLLKHSLRFVNSLLKIFTTWLNLFLQKVL